MGISFGIKYELAYSSFGPLSFSSSILEHRINEIVVYSILFACQFNTIIRICIICSA